MSSASVREYVLASVAARLASEIPTATVERSRRAAVNTDLETLPILVVAGSTWDPDETQEIGLLHCTMGFTVTGYAGGETDVAAEQAVIDLHAQVQSALAVWDPDGWDVDRPTALGVDFFLFDTAESEAPAGSFTAEWSMLVLVDPEARGVALGEFILDVSELS